MDMHPSVYPDDRFIFKWWDANYLILNATKIQEMVFNLKQVLDHKLVVNTNHKITQVYSYKYVGVHFDNLWQPVQ